MILIIGYGFLGRSIYDALKKEGFGVCVISRMFDDATNTDFIKGELHEMPDLIKALPSVKTIIHCVHTTVPATSMEDHVFDVESNVIPFMKLLNQCQKFTVENFIYISSGGAVYGNPESNSPIDEMHVTNPISSYGITKLTCEKYLLLNKHYFKNNCIILRPSNIFGFGQKTNKPQGLVGHISNAAINNKTIEIWGNGDDKKDYLFLSDFTEGIINVVKNELKLKHIIYNISSGNLYSVNYLIGEFEKKYQRKINVVYKPEKIFDVKNIALNNQLFSDTFNWKNSSTIKDFIEKL